MTGTQIELEDGSGFKSRYDSQWHLDKKVPLGLILAMIIQFGSVIWYVADVKKDIELLKADTIVLHQRDSQQADAFREIMHAMEDRLSRLEAKLDRLIERGSK